MTKTCCCEGKWINGGCQIHGVESTFGEDGSAFLNEDYRAKLPRHDEQSSPLDFSHEKISSIEDIMTWHLNERRTNKMSSMIKFEGGLTKDNRSEWADGLNRLEELTKRIKEILKADVKVNGNIFLPDGSEYGKFKSYQTKVKEVEEMLEQLQDRGMESPEFLKGVSVSQTLATKLCNKYGVDVTPFLYTKEINSFGKVK